METSVHKDWLTPMDLELELGIKISTQNKMRMSKRIPYSKIGQKVFYNREKINQWLEAAEVSA